MSPNFIILSQKRAGTEHWYESTKTVEPKHVQKAAVEVGEWGNAHTKELKGVPAPVRQSAEIYEHESDHVDSCEGTVIKGEKEK